VFESTPTLTERIAARLHDAGCNPSSLQIAVTYVPRPGADWATPGFHIDFTRVRRQSWRRSRLGLRHVDERRAS
jgi:hypothetical protein